MAYGTDYLLSFDAAWVSGSVDLMVVMVEYDATGAFLDQQIYSYPISNGNYQEITQAWTPLNSLVATLNIAFRPMLSGVDTSVSVLLDDVLLEQAAPNNAPVFTVDPMARSSAQSGVAYSDTIAGSATDADSDPLTYSKVSGPAWLAVASDGTLSGTPSAGDVGANGWTVQVSDGNGGNNQATLNITVNSAPNTAPVFTTDPVVEINATEGSAYSSSIADNATDADSDPLSFSKVSGPAWLSVASNGALSGTPAAGDVGLNSFSVQVDDGNGGTDTATLEITADGALPGVASAPVPGDGATNVSVDQDLFWTAGAFAVTHDLNGGTTTPPPYIGTYGTTTIDVGTLAYSTTYYWSIDEINANGTNAGPVWTFTTEAAPPPNTAPVFTTDPVVEVNATENSAYSSTLADDATDVDLDPLTFSKVSGPAWLSVATDGTLSGTPAGTDVGLNSFSVQVDDGNGGTDTATLQITVDAAAATWTQLTYDDFEGGWGNWLDGGSDALLSSSFAIGSQGMNLQDNSSTSESELAGSLDLTSYTELKIEFSYVVQSFENTEDFWVRFSSDGGSSWTTIKAYVNNVDFVDNGTRYDPVITIDSGSYTFNNNVKIMFECDASGNRDDVYIDNVRISAK